MLTRRMYDADMAVYARKRFGGWRSVPLIAAARMTRWMLEQRPKP